MTALSQNDMNIKYRSGENHGNGDGLSRVPEEQAPCSEFRADMDITKLRCGGYEKCKRAPRTWNTFLRDVDEAVSLTSGRKPRQKRQKNQPFEHIAATMVDLFETSRPTCINPRKRRRVRNRTLRWCTGSNFPGG